MNIEVGVDPAAYYKTGLFCSAIFVLVSSTSMAQRTRGLMPPGQCLWSVAGLVGQSCLELVGGIPAAFTRVLAMVTQARVSPSVNM